MDEVVILKTGVPAKLTNSFSSKTFSVEGFLTSFSFNLNGEEIKYKYFDTDDFKEQDKKVAGVGQCYLSEKKYLDYIENETLTISPYDAVKELLNNQFSFSNYLAKPKVRDVAGDIVTVNVVEFDDYDFYFKMSRYTFEVEGQSNSILPKNYLRFTSLGFELDIPDTATKEDISRDLNETPRGKFYALNFGSHVGNWSEDIDNTQKRNHAKIITYCCFRINRIVKDLFVKLDNTESLFLIDNLAYYENNTERQDAYNSLSDYEKLLFQLKRSWGYYADSINTGIEGIDGFTAVLPNTPDIDAYIAYYSALTNFYNVVYRLQNTFLNLSDNEKFKYLISILPSTSLNLVPFSLRLELLKDFIDFEFERENVPFSFGSANGVAIVSLLYMQSFLKVGPTEETALQIIFSISESEADDFLDFLLQKPDGKHTYFEKFYDTIDDSSLYRRPVLGWFVDEQPNRKYFIFKIYELWKESKYALGHYELNADSEREFILNTNSFFYEGGEGESYLFDKDEYDTEGFLESIGKKTFLENQFKRTENQGGLTKREHSVTFNPVKELQGVNMFIEKITKDTVTSSYYPVGRLVSVNEKKETFGTYHLYQPIKLGGYVADPDFEGKYFVPQNTQIPAFLFYYVDDYDEIKDFDANVSLAIEITAEVALFFITGGATSIRYLGHLRYFKNATRVGRFFNKTSLEGLAQGTKMSFWKGVEGAAEGFTLSASVVLANIQNMEATANDAKEIDYYRNLSYVFMALTLFGAGASVGARRMAVKGADDTLKEISRLANEENIFIEPNQEIIDMLNTLKGTRTVSLSSFSSRLATISDEAGNKNLVAIFESFLGSGDDVSKQYALFNEFTEKGDDFWKTLNRNGGELLQEWGKMYDANIPQRQLVEVITSLERCNSLIRFNNYQNIKLKLNGYSNDKSLIFLDYFNKLTDSNLIDLNNYSNSIDYFFKYPSEVFKEFSDNAKFEAYIKLLKSRQMLKNNEFQNISILYGNRPIFPPRVSQNNPGISFIDDDGLTDDIIDKTIEIINKTDDVSTISSNTGIPLNIVQKAKDNYFIKERFILVEKDGVIGFQRGRFPKVQSWLDEWNSAIEGSLDSLSLERFKLLIAHEYIEGRLIDEYSMSFRSMNSIDNLRPYDFGAHDISSLIRDGNGFYDFERTDFSIPKIDFEEWSNIDNAINWLVEFYELKK